MTKLNKKEIKKLYPRIYQLGINVYTDQIYHVINEDLEPALDKAGLSREKFSEYFGCQTCPLIKVEKGKYYSGLYPWDVEAVIERMISKKMTGTQLMWD